MKHKMDEVVEEDVIGIYEDCHGSNKSRNYQILIKNNIKIVLADCD